MSEDEVNEQFLQVLQSAQAADDEAFYRAAEEFGEEVDRMIDLGIVNVRVYDDSYGQPRIDLPAPVLLTLVTYLNEYLDLARSSIEANDMGCMVMIQNPLMSDDDIGSLATKIAVLTKCMIRHEENNGRE